MVLHIKMQDHRCLWIQTDNKEVIQSKIIVRQKLIGSKIVFLRKRAFNPFCPPHGLFTCMQPSQHKHDWSILFYKQTINENRTLLKNLPQTSSNHPLLCTDSAFLCKYLFIEIRASISAPSQFRIWNLFCPSRVSRWGHHRSILNHFITPVVRQLLDNEVFLKHWPPVWVTSWWLLWSMYACLLSMSVSKDHFTEADY